jgi:hypothetical protein
MLMKSATILIAWIAIGFFATGGVFAGVAIGIAESGPDNSEAEENFTLEAGDVHEGDLVVFGNSTDVKGTVDGDLVVIGGAADVAGKVTGSLVVFGGTADLESTAEIDGELIEIGGSIIGADKIPGNKSVQSVSGLSWLPRLLHDIHPESHKFNIELPFPRFLHWFNLAALIWWFVISFLVILLLGRNLERTSEMLRADALKALLAGFLFQIALLIVSLGLIVTLIGIPVALLLILFAIGAYWFAVPVGFITLGRMLRDLASPSKNGLFLSAAIGFAVLMAIRFLPFGIGFLVWIIWMDIALGATILSKFGLMTPWFKQKPPAAPLPLPPVPPYDETPDKG